MEQKENCSEEETSGNHVEHLSQSSSTSTSYVKVKRRFIVVEPMIVLSIISTYPLEIIFSQFFYRRVGLTIGINVDNLTHANGSSKCDVDVNDTSYLQREAVQAETSNWVLYIHLVGFIPSVLSYVIFGTLSDKLGRKFLFILPPIGTIIRTGILLVGQYYHLPIWVYFFDNIEKFFGGHELILVASFAYIADTCENESLSLRMTVLDVLLLLSGGISNIAVGYWIDYSGFFWPTVYVAGVKFLSLFYAIFFIPESNEVSTGRNSLARKRLKKENLFKAIELFVKDNNTGRRWKLDLLLFSYFMVSMFNSNSLRRLFEMNAPLCWGSLMMGIYEGMSRVVKGVASILAVSCFRRCMADECIVIIGRITQKLSMLYIPLVESSLMMMFVPFIGPFDVVAIAITRSIMSKLVNKDEQGALFAALTVIYKTCSIISDIVANKLYSATIFILQGRLVFILSGATTFIAAIGLIVYAVKLRRERGNTICCTGYTNEGEKAPLIKRSGSSKSRTTLIND